MEACMYEYRKLRGRIVEKFRTQEEFANAIGISVVSVSKKLNGDTGFSQSDIENWSKILEIKREEFTDYFFA
jgi:transcriptional regulator with XRE-family HTH domain